MCSHFVPVTGGEVARLLMVKSERLAQRKFRTRFAARLCENTLNFAPNLL